ncbi:STAS domain-containing protein [Mycobacterium sp.]|uniref:STAS domain-containing protein n=1 Tax=Mycobacterium sp. TaxID=1785 RepID=UPI002600D47D|nr:STAS domain-containing protein [Mycobacterium sp.]
MRNALPPTGGDFAVVRRQDNDVIVLSVSGAVDGVTAPSLATHLDIAMTDQPRLLVVDLEAVEFMSTSGINLLVELQRLVAPTGTTLRIAADGPATSRPMRLLSIDRLIDLYASTDEALAG